MCIYFGLEDVGFDLFGSFYFSVIFVCGLKIFLIIDFIIMFVFSICIKMV